MAMVQNQEVLTNPSDTRGTALGPAGKAERMLMTFFSVAFALLALLVFVRYSNLLGRVGWLPKFVVSVWAVASGEKALFIGFAVCALCGLIVAIYREKRPYLAEWDKVDYWTTAVVRYFLAYIFLTYGSSKIFHDQFETPFSVMDTRLADVSGIWLVWHFFGYSYAYTLFIASSQILSAILFFFRRTTTLAAMILLPVIANIVFMNIAYAIPVKMYSSIFLAMTLFLLSQDARRIIALLWTNQPIGAPTFAVLRKGMLATVLKYVVIAVVIVVPATGMYYSHLLYAGATTPLTGIWSVQEYRLNGQTLPESEPSVWKKVYIENAKQIEIRRTQGTGYTKYYSRAPLLDSAKQAITLRNNRSKPYFQGTYALRPDGTLVIDGHDTNGSALEVVLKRTKITG